jgi:hypothetical protein
MATTAHNRPDCQSVRDVIVSFDKVSMKPTNSQIEEYIDSSSGKFTLDTP